MSSDLFMRKIELYVDQTLFKGDEFTINFDVPYDDGKDVNVAEINIYNLSDKTLNQIKKGSKIILNAGYRNDVGSILLGVVQHVKTEWQGVDKITTIQCLDGNESWLKLPVKRTYKPGIAAKQILNDVLTLTGLAIGAFSLPVNKVYPGGKTVNTSLSNIVTQIAKDCGAKVHVTRGKVFIRPKNEGDAIGFVLNSTNGLISSPTPITKDIKVNGVEKTVHGYKVVSLLNHRITTDSLLELKSKTANGIYRVESGRHYKTASSFYTEVECYPV